MELKQRLVDFKIKYSLLPSFNQSQIKEIFDLYNDVTHENMQITSCQSCVRRVISRLKKECRKYNI